MLANNKPAQIVEVPAGFGRIFPLHHQHWAVNRFPLPVISVAEPPLFEAAPAPVLNLHIVCLFSSRSNNNFIRKKIFI